MDVKPAALPHPQSLPAAQDPLVGRTLDGRFRVLGLLGQGGMGRVYRGTQLALDRAVALKVLSPGFPSHRDPEFERRFLREASLTARLRSPHTVTVLDSGRTQDGVLYLAMELLEGRTLAQVLAQGPLAWPAALDVAAQVAVSLREAHALGVVHRDLKPANVMVLHGERAHVKVLDFGLVKSFTGEPLDAHEMTQHGTFLGSPQYMAPEQARGQADARSDVYSLGVLLFHALAGRPPFASRDTLELVFAHHKEAPPRIAELRPDVAVPAEVEALVRRCLAKAPDARFQSMDALLEALRALGGEPGSGAHAAVTGPSGRFGAAGPANVSGPSSCGVTDTAPAVTPAGAPDARATAPASAEVAAEPGAPAQRRRAGVAVGGAVAALLLAGGTTVVVLRQEAPVPAPVVVAPAAPAAPASPAPAAPAVVRFRIASEPSGARVELGGEVRGVTPFVLEVPASADGLATAELTFTLDGHQPERVVAGGSGEVVLSQRLTRRAPARPLPAAVPARAVARPPPPAADEDVVPAALLQAPVARPATAVARAAPPAPAAPLPPPGPLPEGAEPPRELAGNAAPEFPASARGAGREGLVVLKLVVTEAGAVGPVTVLRGEEPFVSAAVRAVRTWRYAPARVDGRPRAVTRVVRVPFRLR